LYQGTDEHVIRLEAALAGTDSGVSQHRICGVSSGRSLTLAGVGEVLDNPLGRTRIGVAGEELPGGMLARGRESQHRGFSHRAVSWVQLH